MDKLDPKTDGCSPDLQAENVDQLRELFPEAFADGRLNIDTLLGLLGEETDEGDERYGLNWPGKAAARRIAQIPSAGTLRPAKAESLDWDTTQNLMIEGDNLEVLKLLQKSYHGAVKIIYIDPPYNTGNEFIYPDRFQDNLDTYLRYTGQTDAEGLRLSANAETGGRYHTNWLNMMYPRLKLARNLLREDGAIFVSIDDHEVHNLRLLMDEVFGAKNLVGQVAVVTNPRGRQSEAIASTHEYLLVYGRDAGRVRPPGAELTDAALAEYKHLDSDGRRYRLRGLRHRGNASRRIDRPAMYFPIYVDPVTRKVSLTQGGSFTEAVVPRKSSGEDGRWEWGPATVQARIHLLEGVMVSTRCEWDVYQREYLEDESGNARRKKWKSIWGESDINYQNGKSELKALFSEEPFEYPKPTGLLRKIVAGVTAEADVILDFFAGSGTTGDAVMRQNAEDGGQRRCILVQLPEKTKSSDFPTIADITKARLRAVSKAISRERGRVLPGLDATTPLDLGFRVFKLDSSNIKAWDGGHDTIETDLLTAVENIKPNRSEDDLLFELLLKFGLDLATQVTARTIEGRTVFVLGEGLLVVCLAPDLPLTVVEGIGRLKSELAPEEMKVVFRDACFADDVAKTNAVKILEMAGVTSVQSL